MTKDEKILEIINSKPTLKIGLDDFYGKQTAINMLKEAINYIELPTSRYFSVIYMGQHSLGRLIGSLDITTNGQYINRILTMENIKTANSELNDIVITNVIEMTKDDFDSWTDKCE